MTSVVRADFSSYDGELSVIVNRNGFVYSPPKAEDFPADLRQALMDWLKEADSD